ncbi:hypothetical protein [Streptomyces sp. NPDC090022]|uniref:hypothetical protein n=1 Tax=Streptomyces sp. NPDC090022 TaxID=3365920 RepID=UPI00381C0605
MSATTPLVHGGSAAPDAPVTRVGGLPLAPAGTGWPGCAVCAGPLQFLAQVVLDDGRGVLAVFMCAHRPGRCEQWSATGGGNRAFLFPAAGLRPLRLPHPDAELGGVPEWLPYEETPHCPGCVRPMDFAAMLTEDPDPLTAPDFGSGRAYAFTCTPCARAAFGRQC